MEAHPVPQNILDVEFKLFGSFTFRQFSKILIGSLIGVGIFFFNINPLIKIPLIAISVLVGLGLAIIPNLGVWLNGFIRALFVAPRYVWIKAAATPELLLSETKKDTKKDKNVSSAIAKGKVDINDLPLSRLFTTKTSTQDNSEQFKKIDESVSKDNNFSRVYEDVFGVDMSRNPYNSLDHKTQNQLHINKDSTTTKVSGPMLAKQDTKVESPNQSKDINFYIKEIERLKFELSRINKDADYKKKEQEIINQINDIYHEVKILQGEHRLTNDKRVIQKTQALSANSNIEGRVVLGIVVSKADKPIPGAEVGFKNISNNSVIKITTSNEGKFTTVQPIPKGDYSVEIKHPKLKFHTYKINIADQSLPAYKFREK